MGLSRVLHYAGRSEEAIEAIDRAMQIDPNYPGYYLHVSAQSQFQLGRYDKSVETLTRRITRDPKTDISRVFLAASYGHLGRIAEAKWAWAEVIRVNQNYSLEYRQKVSPYKNPTDFEHLVKGLRKADVPPLWHQPSGFVY